MEVLDTVKFLALERNLKHLRKLGEKNSVEDRDTDTGGTQSDDFRTVLAN